MEAATGTSAYRVPASAPPVSREDDSAEAVPWFENLAIFLVFGILFVVVGYQIIVNQHVVPFDALDRLSRAFMVWYNDPPKLAAIGFSIPPGGTFALLPAAAVRSFVTSGFALPLTSGIFAAGALVMINLAMAAGGMGRGPRLPIVALVAINPMFGFYAMNGLGEAVWFLFIGVTIYSMVAWFRAGSPRYLIGAGIGLAIASMTNYEFLAWALLLALAFGAGVGARSQDRDEVQGSVIALLAPVLYALGLWIFFNAIVLGDPFAWVGSTTAVPVNSVASHSAGFDLGTALENLLRINLIFPVTFFVLPALFVDFARSRDIAPMSIAALILLTMAYPVISAAIDGSTSVIELRDALPTMFATLAGLAWLYYGFEDSRVVVWAVCLILAVIAIPTAISQMRDFPHQNLEQAFVRAIETGQDQEGTGSRGGFQVGVGQEQSAANFISRLNLGTRDVLTDNARTFAVIDINGDPAKFFDRADKGDGQWRKVLNAPGGRVTYMLVERNGADLILQRYPGADKGKVAFLDPVAENDRYAVLKVGKGAPGSSKSSGSQSQSGSSSSSSGSQGGTTTTTPSGGATKGNSHNGATQPSTTPAIGATPAGSG